MASKTQLVSSVAELIDEDEAMVRLTARLLSEQGLMSLGRAGRGGMKVSATDATNLLLGSLSSRPARAKRLVETFRSLKGASRRQQNERMPMCLGPVSRAATFGEAMDQLFQNGLSIGAWM